jgi:hypothetical protein
MGLPSTKVLKLVLKWDQLGDLTPSVEPSY